jgi:translocator protein
MKTRTPGAGQPAPADQRNPGARWLALAISIAICFAAAGIGSWLTTPALHQWYPALRKPDWTPPNWIFAPVWTALYLSMAIAGWMVWRGRPSPYVAFALQIFALQLILNVLWSGLFFGLHAPGIALVEIAILWCAVAATVAAFHRISTVAAWILLPYLGWVGFAAILNFAIWQLNRVS